VDLACDPGTIANIKVIHDLHADPDAFQTFRGLSQLTIEIKPPMFELLHFIRNPIAFTHPVLHISYLNEIVNFKSTHAAWSEIFFEVFGTLLEIIHI
jgi:hypothetical protein